MKARIYANSSICLSFGFPESCPTLLSMRIILGASPIFAAGNVLMYLKGCPGTACSSVSAVVEFPGSSNYLLQGLVTYANEAKRKILGVSHATLKEHNAVSLEAAIEMATGAHTSLDSDFALSTTGIAGSDGDSEEKPAGLVVIALSDSTTCWVQAIKLANRNRNLVRVMNCAVALDMLRRRLLDETPIVDYPFIPRMEDKIISLD